MCDLSVIMPIYNVAAFLDEAIEAILTEKDIYVRSLRYHANL